MMTLSPRSFPSVTFHNARSESHAVKAAEQCVSRRGVVLASFVAQVRGVLLNECPLGGLHVGCSVKLLRMPDSRYDVNCIAVMER